MKRLLLFAFGILFVCGCQVDKQYIKHKLSALDQKAISLEAGMTISNIEWIDGDSGIINGTYKFDIFGVDAPEIEGAKCSLEMVRGEASKQFMKDKSFGGVKLKGVFTKPQSDEFLVSLGTENTNLNLLGIMEGHLAEFYDPKFKPDWCGDVSPEDVNRNRNFQTFCFYQFSSGERWGNGYLNNGCDIYKPLYRNLCLSPSPMKIEGYQPNCSEDLSRHELESIVRFMSMFD